MQDKPCKACARFTLAEPPLAEPHERWCGRTGVSHPLLPDLTRYSALLRGKMHKFKIDKIVHPMGIGYQAVEITK